MRLTAERREEIYRRLPDRVCEFCQSAKVSGMSFCRICYYSLPRHLQSALYNKFGQGYEEAYEKAIAYLKQRMV